MPPLHRHYLERKLLEQHSVQMQMEVREVPWGQALALLALHHLQQPVLFLGEDLPVNRLFLELNSLLVKLLNSLGYNHRPSLLLVQTQIHYLDQILLPQAHLLLARHLPEIISQKHRQAFLAPDWLLLLRLAVCLARLNRLLALDLLNISNNLGLQFVI